MDKPEKPNAVLPSSFGGIKEPFSADKIKNGFESDIPQIFEGGNLNDWLDKTGKKFEYVEKIADFINELPINNIITTDENNKLIYLDKNKLGGGFNLFDMKISDHVLIGEESIGWALQGSLVTKTYPQAVEKIVELYNLGDDTTYRGIPCKVLHPDGRYIADISQKSTIDELFASTGIADFYILDSVNEQFYLPKSRWFNQFTVDTSLVNTFNEAGLPNITGKFVSGSLVTDGTDVSGAFENLKTKGPTGYNGGPHGPLTNSFDASKSNDIYGKSETVQPPSSNKLLYYKVGNTVINESLIDAGQVLSELNLLSSQKADINLANVSNELVQAGLYSTFTKLEDKWAIEWFSNPQKTKRVWCRQKITIPVNSTTVISLLKPFSNTDYSYSFSFKAPNTNTDYTTKSNMSFAAITTTSVTPTNTASGTRDCTLEGI